MSRLCTRKLLLTLAPPGFLFGILLFLPCCEGSPMQRQGAEILENPGGEPDGGNTDVEPVGPCSKSDNGEATELRPANALDSAILAKAGTGLDYCVGESAEGHSVMRDCPIEGFYGQDGDYGPTNSVLLDNDDGTISDQTTGLMWQAGYSRTLSSATEAVQYCHRLELAGYCDWRLPNRFEWETLFFAEDPLKEELAPGGARQFEFATSTIDADNEDNLWYVYYDREEGLSLCCTDREYAGNYVRCVRSEGYEKPTERFADNADGTVTDLPNQLMWTKEAWPPPEEAFALTGDAFWWQEALEHCEGLEMAGHADWRLPSINELVSLVDLSVRNLDEGARKIDESVFVTGSPELWSATPKSYITIYLLALWTQVETANGNRSEYEYAGSCGGYCGTEGDGRFTAFCVRRME